MFSTNKVIYTVEITRAVQVFAVVKLFQVAEGMVGKEP